MNPLFVELESVVIDVNVEVGDDSCQDSLEFFPPEELTGLGRIIFDEVEDV